MCHFFDYIMFYNSDIRLRLLAGMTIKDPEMFWKVQIFKKYYSRKNSVYFLMKSYQSFTSKHVALYEAITRLTIL